MSRRAEASKKRGRTAAVTDASVPDVAVAAPLAPEPAVAVKKSRGETVSKPSRAASGRIPAPKPPKPVLFYKTLSKAYETRKIAAGFKRVAGVDEVGLHFCPALRCCCDVVVPLWADVGRSICNCWAYCCGSMRGS
jgi:hypothetical protein